MSKWRILLLNTQMEAGGAQKAALELGRGLESLGHEVTVATLYDKGSYVEEFSVRYGLRIVDLQMKPPGGFITKVSHFVEGLVQLRNLLRSEQIDILQTFDFYSNAIGPLVARTANVPVCVTSQRSSSRGAKKWLRILDRAITNSQLVQMMTAVSEDTRLESIDKEGIHPRKIVTIPNGVNLKRFAVNLSRQEYDSLYKDIGVDESAIIVTTVARLYPVKGHKYLLEAIPSILTVMSNVHFLFIGEGPLMKQLEQDVSRAGLSNNVHLLGARSDIPQILTISHLFVLPSLWEGLPNAILEAMAAGLPVVSTDVNGCTEVVEDEETGLLVPPANPGRMTDAILSILQDEAKATSFGIAGRDRARREFSQDKNLSNYVNLYSDLLAGTGN